MDDQHTQHVGRVFRTSRTEPPPLVLDVVGAERGQRLVTLVDVELAVDDGAALRFHLGQLERRRAQLAARHPDAPSGAVCAGDGLVTIPSPDGPDHYACLGCRACAVRTAEPEQQPERDPFARLPEVPSDADDIW